MTSIPLGVLLTRIPISIKSFKIIIFVVTFSTYISYHMTRKSLSVVKNGLHANCTEYAIHNHIPIPPDNPNFCWFPPFNKDDYNEKFSQLDFAFLSAYAIGMFLSGHIAERINLRYYLTAGAVLSGVASGLFGLGYFASIHSFGYYMFIQIISGLFQATGWPAVVTLMANWYGKTKRGLMMGLWNSNSSLGNILGSLISGIFVLDKWGWSFMLPAIFIAVNGIICYNFIVPHPSDIGLPDQNFKKDEEIPDETQNNDETNVIIKKNEAISILDAIRAPGVAEYSLCLFFIKLVSYSFLFCLPRYVNSQQKYDASQSANISTVFDIGGIIGGLVFGMLTDRLSYYALVCVPSLLLAAPMIYIYYLFGSLHLYLNFGLLFFLGFLVNGPYGLITTVVSADLGTNDKLKNNSKALATITAIIDGTGSIGAAIGPALVGYLEKFGWDYSFMILSISIAVSGLLLSRRVFNELKEIRHLRNAAAENDTSHLIN